MGKLLEQRNRALDDINAGRTVKKIRDLESRVRELETQLAANNPLLDEAANRIDELEEENARLIGRPIPLSTWQKMDQQLATSQAYAEQLRKALGKFRDDVLFRIGCSSPYRNVAKEYFEYIRPILSLPTDTSALDAYVSEKVKEIIESHAPDGRNVTNAQHVEMRHKFVEQIATLTRQRDLAVEALHYCVNQVPELATVPGIATAIKESEAMAQGETP